MARTERNVFHEGRGRESRPWMPWYPNDWLSNVDLQNLKLAAQGLYMNFLMATWSCEQRGAMDARTFEAFSMQNVARMGRMRSRFDALWLQIVAARLVSKRKGGGWYSRRILREHGDLGSPSARRKSTEPETAPNVQRTEKEQKESKKEQTVRDGDSYASGGLVSMTAICKMVEALGGKQFGGSKWRQRIFRVCTTDGGAGQLLSALEHLQNSLAGRTESPIENPGGFIGEVIMRLAGERGRVPGSGSRGSGKGTSPARLGT